MTRSFRPLLAIPFLLLTMSSTPIPDPDPLYPAVRAYLDARKAEFDQIPAERKAALEAIAAYVRTQQAANRTAHLLFVCTHNSRRSQLSETWAAVAATYVGLGGVGEGLVSESAGLEQTVFNERAIAALNRAGILLQKKPRPAFNGKGGPQYNLAYGEANILRGMHSKTIAQATQNWQAFAAVMTCSDADEKCPVVPGAESRFRLPYEDPKVSDGTPQEAATYDKRCAQIAREQLYVFTQVVAGR